MAAQVVNYSMNIDDVFNPIYMAVATGAATAESNVNPRAGTGTSRTMPVSSAWNSVDYGNGLLCAVSATSGTIAATSVDGTTWVQRVLPTTTTWQAVKSGYAGSTFRWAAVANANNYAATSPDGATWTARTISGSTYAWKSLAYGNGVWVALANSAEANTLRTAVSADGITWSNNNTGTITCPGTWSSIFFGNGRFVAVCSGSTKAAWSTDGINWNESGALPANTAWVSVTYGGGVWIAVTATDSVYAARSIDNGATWSQITFPATSTWRAVIYGKNIIGEGIFTCYGALTVGNYSLDGGVTWIAKVQVTMTYTAACYAPLTWRSNDSLTIYNNATLTCNTDQKKFWSTMSIDNGKLLVTNATSTGITFAMGRASGATAGTITPVKGNGEIEFTGNWINLGTGSGSAGQTMTAPFTDYIPALWVQTSSGSAVYEQWLNATGSYGDNNLVMHEGLEAVSNGVRGNFFTQGANAAPYGPINITGTTISPRAQYYIDVNDTTGIIEGAQVFGANTTANSVVNKVISSTTLELNNATANLGTVDWTSVAYGNVSGTTPTFVAVSKIYSNVAMYSTNGGVSWTKATLPFKAEWTSICYGSAAVGFFAVCSGSNLGASSVDGITWKSQYMVTSMNWKSVASNGTSYVAVGAVTAGTATTIGGYSADGITWAATTMTSAIWQAVCWGTDRFVAVSSTTITNWDADGAGTWTNGGAVTSATWAGIAYNGTRFVIVSGSSNISRYSTDGAVSWSNGGSLTNTVSTGICWTGTTFIVCSAYTTAGSSAMTSTDSAVWAARASQTRNQWAGVAYGNSVAVMVAGSNFTTLYVGSAASTSDATGVTWADRSAATQAIFVPYTVFNPYKNQLTNQITFGNNINGNKVPLGAIVRCPNVMITSLCPANLHTVDEKLGCSIVSTNGGPVTMTTVLNDECYHNFGQAQRVTLTDVGFSIPFLITECYDFSVLRVAFALQPVRRYYSGTWLSRELRYGQNRAWNKISNSDITDLKICVGSTSAQYGTTGATSPINLSYTDSAVFTRFTVYCLNPIKPNQTGFLASTMMTNCTFTEPAFYGVAPFSITTSDHNTITGTKMAPCMRSGKMGLATSATRIGIDPATGNSLINNTKYYFKVRSYRDWTDLTHYVEGPVVSATPFLATSKWFPRRFSAVNTASTTVTFNWERRDPSAATVAIYEIFRGTVPGFVRNFAARVYTTATVGTITTTDATVSNGTTYYYVMRKYDGSLAGVTNSAGTTGQYTITTSGKSFLSDLGTVANCFGTAGTRKVYLLSGAATNFLAAMVTAGMPISGGGLDTGTVVTSVDNELEITVSKNILSDFTVSTLSLGACAGMYVSATNVTAGCKIVSVDSATQITVDLSNAGTVSGTITFLWGTEGPEVEVYVAGAKQTASNLLFQSWDFTNATWVKTNITATAAIFVGPEVPAFTSIAYTAIGVRLYSIPASNAVAKMVNTQAGLSNATSYCFSGYFRTDPSIWNTNNVVSVTITIDTTSPTTSTFNVTGKWQRIEVPFTSTNTTHNFTVQINENGRYIYPSNLQVNTGSTATTPVATTTAAVTLNPVVQEITAAYAWGRATGGTATNQGIELVLAAAPTNTHYTEVFMGTSTGFIPSPLNIVDSTIPATFTAFNFATTSNTVVETITQLVKGQAGTLFTLVGSANNVFKNITYDFDWGVGAIIANISSLSNNILLHNFNVSHFRNFIATSPFTTANDASTIILQNINMDTYDVPHQFLTLDTVVKGVAGAHAEPLDTVTTWAMGDTSQGFGVANVTVYDTNFHEMYHSPTTGALNLVFNDSSKTVKPYAILSGTPKFSNTGKLYLQTVGDSIEFTWPHYIKGVTSFRNLEPKLSGNEFGTALDTLNGLKIEYAIDNGTGVYGNYHILNGPNLVAETITSATVGFKIKIKLTAKTGMKYTGQTGNFILNEQIRGATSLATAYVREDYDYGTTGEIILDTIVGTFIAGEAIVRHSDAAARATNLATNTNFALFPSNTSYIDGLQIYTNVNTAIHYPVAYPTLTITGLIQGTQVDIMRASDEVRLSGTTSTGLSYAFTYEYDADIPVYVIAQNYKYLYLRVPYTLTATNNNLLLQQTLDRNYLNP